MENVALNLLDNFLNELIDKESFLQQLITLIENSNSLKLRLSGINALNTIKKKGFSFEPKSNEIFQVFENLLISDSSDAIRSNAASFLGINFAERAFDPMLWALHHENSPKTLEYIIESLINYINNLDEFTAINTRDLFQDIDFKICIQEKLERKRVEDIKDVIINYFCLVYLKKVFWRLKYVLKDCIITSLDFTFKELTTLPESLKYLTGLKKLVLKYNQLTVVPDWISSLNSLEILNLNVNNINKIPSSISQLKLLKEFSLWKNDLTSLPESLCELYNLELLNLRLNNLEFLPSALGKLENLKILNLHDNRLNNIPYSIASLSKLENLNLSWNLIASIPIHLTNLESLKYLDLERNELEQIPSDFSNMKSLILLNLSDNHLRSLPANMKFSKNLKILNLSRNHLDDLPIEFIQLGSLEELYIGQNNFQENPECIQILKDKGVKIIN